MRTILFSTLLLLALGIYGSNTHAGEPEFCGTPKDVNISTEATPFCDIHNRRLAYRKEAIKLKEQMNERARNFAEPRKVAYERYLENVQKLNDERASDAAASYESQQEDELEELEETAEVDADEMIEDTAELENLE